jgi:Uncharacterised protein family (UPF0164)
MVIASLSMRAYSSSGTEGAAFLDIPVGAGPAALGSAYTALANDAYATVYNPAGLGFLTGNQVAGQHLSYLESIHYEHFSFVHPFGKKNSSDMFDRGLGFSMQYLGTGDITATRDTDGAAIGSFSSYYASYNASYGQTIGEKLALGMTAKWIQAKIDDVSAHAYAADFGAMYHMTDKLTLASTLTNLGSKLKFISEGDNLPVAFHIAGAYKLQKQFMLTSEGVYRKTGLASAHFGGQWRPLDALSLRVGYKTDTLSGLSPVAGVTAGIGLHVWGQELAYAFSPYGDLGNAQYFSLLVHFGAEEEAKRNLIQYRTIKKHQTVMRSKNGADDVEPEYTQLMQLLASDDDARMAAVRPAGDHQ